jgi:hypothetical protein
MSTQEYILPTKRWFFDLWSKGDLSVADEIVDPTYAPSWIQIPEKGAEPVKHEVRYFRNVFPDLKYEIIDYALKNEKVWVRYKATGTHEGDAWGFEPTHRWVEFEGVTIFTIGESGKIIDRWGVFCFYDIFTELGLVPPWWKLGQHLKPQR